MLALSFTPHVATRNTLRQLKLLHGASYKDEPRASTLWPARMTACKDASGEDEIPVNVKWTPAHSTRGGSGRSGQRRGGKKASQERLGFDLCCSSCSSSDYPVSGRFHTPSRYRKLCFRDSFCDSWPRGDPANHPTRLRLFADNSSALSFVPPREPEQTIWTLGGQNRPCVSLTVVLYLVLVLRLVQ